MTALVATADACSAVNLPNLIAVIPFTICLAQERELAELAQRVAELEARNDE